MSAKLLQVIQVYVCRGRGTDDDPHRTVTEYYDTDGTWLAERDPVGVENAAAISRNAFAAVDAAQCELSKTDPRIAVARLCIGAARAFMSGARRKPFDVKSELA